MSTPAATRATSRLAALGGRLPRGVAANEQLTAIVATVLLVLLAVEGATLLDMRQYLSVHAFVGVLLIPVVGLKLASTSWRMLRYYLGAEEYVSRGPPHAVLRMLVAPVVVVSTVFLFGTGVALLALDETRGQVVTLHQASFIVWVGAVSIHVLTRLSHLPAAWRRLPGRGLRIGVVAASLAAGLTLAVATLPAVNHLQDRITAHAGFDDH
jgi:hypothetical protein